MSDRTRRMTIGQLARAAGVSAQTLRHYDAIGLLRPSSTSAAGYRLYGDRDRAQLELIRALRAVDFDLPTIGRLLRGAATLRGVAELHLRTLDHQARVIARRRAILRMLLGASSEPTADRLARLQTLAGFERIEREGFIAEQLRTRLGGAGKSPFERVLIGAAAVDLPEPATEGQVEAWLELAEMVSDPTFLARHRRSGPQSADERPTKEKAAFRQMALVYEPAGRAARAGVSPTSRAGRAIVRRWARSMAANTGAGPWRKSSPTAERRQAQKLLANTTSEQSAREARFWDLVAVLKPEIGESLMSVAWKWLMRGLREWANEAGPTSG